MDPPRQARASSLGASERRNEATKRKSKTQLERLDDKRAFVALIDCQERHMATILTELDQGAKESHWVWYIFPTEKAGACDEAETRITEENAIELCRNESTAMDWQKCLEKICDLLEARGQRPADGYVLPLADHGRVYRFVEFWASYAQTPDWLLQVCERLKPFFASR
ncbi:Carboxylic ester hydrolase [Durusdinium trenchii]|uniref:Carboxylic ester hydrolase n=1 Tax=Durusdinium trenchii TaxID=1381693 RepID=A0ABP0I542_9DINO